MPWCGDEGDFIAIVACDFTFKVTVFAPAGPNTTCDLIIFIGTAPLKVDAIWCEAAIEPGFERTEGHFAVTIGTDRDEGRTDQVEMLAAPGLSPNDPLFAYQAIDVRHQPVSNDLGIRMKG